MQSLTASRPAQQISTVSFIVYVHNAHAAKQTHWSAVTRNKK